MRASLIVILIVASIAFGSQAAQSQTGSASPTQHVTLKWLGTAGWEIQIGQTKILIDPFLTHNPAFQGQDLKDVTKGVTHILLTHGHMDHVGDTIALAGELGAQVLANADLGDWLQFRGVPYTEKHFVTPAPYRVVRHPLYVGFILAFWATPVMTVSHLLFAVATTAYILIAIQLEERDLVAAHPEYADYRRRVPMLVPGMKRASHVAEDTAKPAAS